MVTHHGSEKQFLKIAQKMHKAEPDAVAKPSKNVTVTFGPLWRQQPLQRHADADADADYHDGDDDGDDGDDDAGDDVYDDARAYSLAKLAREERIDSWSGLPGIMSPQ